MPEAKPRPRRIAADEAHAWARNLRLHNNVAKYVLTALTLYVNGEGCCFVSIGQLAEDCELAPNTVRSKLAWLDKVGAIARFKQWIDETGVRNKSGKGRQTTDEIKLMIDTPAHIIEAKAAGLVLETDVDGAEISPPNAGASDQDAEISPPNAGASDGAVENLISPPSAGASAHGGTPLGLRLDSNSLESSESLEPEPEDSPHSPPSGGNEGDDDGDLSRTPFSAFSDAYPEKTITNYYASLAEWEKLSETDRADAISGAKGYAAFVQRERGNGRNRSIKDAHLWLRNKLWTGYLSAGRTAESAAAVQAASFDALEGSDEWNAWTLYFKICGKAGIPSFRLRGPLGKQIATMPSQWPPIGSQLTGRPLDLVVWQGSPEFAAWLRKLRELPNANIGLRSRLSDGKMTNFLEVPSLWPPRKDGSLTPDGNRPRK